MIRRAVLLDRDGVINVNRADYCKTWDEFQFIDGSLLALQQLAQTDFWVIVVTNQSGIGRGIMTQGQVEEIHQRMTEQVTRAGGRIDGILFCPHRPDEGCQCRKPLPGMLLQAEREYGLDLAVSYMIGDSLNDVAAGRAAGCTPLLVRTGRGAAALAQLVSQPDESPVVVDDLAGAVEWILQHETAG